MSEDALTQTYSARTVIQNVPYLLTAAGQWQDLVHFLGRQYMP